MNARADIEDFFHDAPCGLVSVDANGEILRINRTLADWLGADTQGLIGSAFRDLLSVGGRMAFETHIRPMLKMQGQVNEISIDLLDNAGERIPFITNISERRDADDALISTRFALLKSHDRRLYEKTLLKARQIAEDEAKLERSTALLRDQFIAVLGHDLRNPLSAIISGVRIVKRRTELTEQLNLVLDHMMDSAWRAEKLVKDILDFALGTLGEGLVLQRRTVTDLEDVLAQVVEEIKLGAGDRIIQSRFEMSQPVFLTNNA